MSDLRL